MDDLTFILVQTENDIQNIASKAAVIWREHFTSIITKQQIDYMLTMFLSPNAIEKSIKEEHYEFYKICKGNDLIGFFSIKKESKRLFLSKLYIEKAQRGNGFARQTMNYIEALTRQADLNTIWLTCNKYNAQTLAIYDKMGFHIFEEAVNDIGNGYVMDDYYLEKRL